MHGRLCDGAQPRPIDDRSGSAHGGRGGERCRSARTRHPPEGLKDEAIGGHSRTLAHDGGGLYFTETELDLLRPNPSGRAFSIWTT
ncbi:hypothetical protein GCM10010178_44000 [Lentzea flava]|uniref:Uncharacterized protein n=1 Tax=Lentzea flava TaxID=103732 RepID=A0ABQ2UNQ1_9PSEU|nr:hypothetical protein GCM10010178_44000 [Lentzea flava]